jgi:death-on-curing protein
LIFLTVELVEAIHSELIDVYGGSHGLRDHGLLESAVGRAENKATYDPDSSVAEVAAALAWGLIKNHAFIDGNKRVGFAAMAVFLHANGFALTCSEVEETAIVLRVAGSDMSEEQWTVWVMRSTAPIRSFV